MNTKDVFKRINRLNDESYVVEQLVKRINDDYNETMELCPHELVFMLHDNHPRKMHIEGVCFCPACGKMATIYDSKKLVESPFSSSRVVSLDNLSLICDKETLQGIRSEVSDNMELYYNDNISDYFLSIRMEEILKDREYKYNSPMVLRKKRNDK